MKIETATSAELHFYIATPNLYAQIILGIRQFKPYSAIVTFLQWKLNPLTLRNVRTRIGNNKYKFLIQKLVELSLYFIAEIAIRQGTPRSRLEPQCSQREETGASVIRALATLAPSAVRPRYWRHVIVPMDNAWFRRGYSSLSLAAFPPTV